MLNHLINNPLIELLIVGICACFWRIGGKYHHNWRRIPIPILLASYVALKFHCWCLFFFTGLTYGFTIPMGYGIPDKTDKGSWLGRIVLKWCNNNDLLASWLTRGLLGSFIAFIGGLPIILHILENYTFYISYIVYCGAISALLSYYKVKDKYIEPAIGAIIASIVFI